MAGHDELELAIMIKMEMKSCVGDAKFQNEF